MWKSTPTPIDKAESGPFDMLRAGDPGQQRGIDVEGLDGVERVVLNALFPTPARESALGTTRPTFA
jgi:hypothetical protein